MAYSGANPAEGVTSTGNSTIVNLAANAVFTGASEDVTIYSNIKINVYSSNGSAINGLVYQQSNDGTFYPPATDVYTIPATTQKSFSVAVNMKFFRLVYTNGATATTALVIQVLYNKSDKQPSSVRPQDGRSNDNDFVEVVSALIAYNPATDAFDRLRQTTANGLAVDVTRMPTTVVTGPLTDTQIRATPLLVAGTRPNAGTSAVGGSSHLTVGGSDGTNLRPILLDTTGRQSVIGTFFQTTQPVSGTFFQATQPVSGTFFQATQPVSLATNTPVIAAGTAAIGNLNELRAATLAVTTTAASGTAATLTLPAVAAQFHYLTSIEIVLYSAAARTGAAAPTVVTTTNLPGAIAFTFSTAGAIGTTDIQDLIRVTPLKSLVVNTITTIVCPIAAGGIWRITATYFTAP